MSTLKIQSGLLEAFQGKRLALFPKFKAKSSIVNVAVPDWILFAYRTPYFTDSGIIGSKELVAINYQRFEHPFFSKHEKKPKAIKGLEGLYSLKRLSEMI